ncbi:Hypothetical protein GLP15_1381 [Giardia lamblia P15]|uniref:Uncharacterized protein n=1 Tax=Giardia intestinalis (strain P15) TaxID=658858 RepID=E1EZA6_GIAIA|nr:Hypothetical protein GLP15_1381 [Giardia lamblia P15]
MGSGISAGCYSTIVTPHPEAVTDDETSLLQIGTSQEVTETSSVSDLQRDPDKDTSGSSTHLSRGSQRPKSCSVDIASKLVPPHPPSAPIAPAMPHVRTRRHKVHDIASIPDAKELLELTNGGEIKFVPSSITNADLAHLRLSSGQLSRLAAIAYHGRARYARLLLVEGSPKYSSSLLLLYELLTYSLQSGRFIISLLDLIPETITALSYVRLTLTCLYWDYPEYSTLYPVLLRLAGTNEPSHSMDPVVTTVCFNAYPGLWSSPASIWCRKLRVQNHLCQHIQQFLADYQKKLRVKNMLAGEAISNVKKYKLDYSFVIELLVFDIIRRILVGDANLAIVMSNLLPIFSCTNASYTRAIHTNSPKDIYSIMTNTIGSPSSIPDLFQLLLNKVGIPAFRIQFSETFAGNLVAIEGVWYVVDTIKYVTATRFYGSDYVNIPLHWYCRLFPQTSNLLCTASFPILYSADLTEATDPVTSLSSLKYNLNFIKNQCFCVSELYDAMSFLKDRDEEVHKRIRRTLDTTLSITPKIVSFNQPASLSNTGSFTSILQLTNSPLTPTGRPPSTLREPSPRRAKTSTNLTKSKSSPPLNKQSTSPIKKFIYRQLGNSTSYIQANERISLSQTLVNMEGSAAQTLMKGLSYILHTGAYSMHGWILPKDCTFDGYTVGSKINNSNTTSSTITPLTPASNLCVSQPLSDLDLYAMRYAIYTLLERLLAELKIALDSCSPNLKLNTPPLSARPSSIGRHMQKAETSMMLAISNFQVRIEQQCFYRIQFFKDTIMARQPFILKEHKLSLDMMTRLNTDTENFKNAVTKLKEHIDTLVFDNKLRMMLVFDDQNFSTPITEEEEYNLLSSMNKLLKHVFYASKCSSREQMTRKGRGILGSNGRLYFLVEFVKLL